MLIVFGGLVVIGGDGKRRESESSRDVIENTHAA